jgi:membrane protein
MASFRQSRSVRALVATVKDYGRLRIGDHAAALTYYAVLAVFPGLIVIVALLNLFGDEGTVESVLRIIEEVAPGSAAETFESTARNAIEGGGAGIALLLGTLVALYSASGYIGAFNRAANDIYGVEETRPFWHTLPRQVVLTVLVVVVLAVTLLAIVVTGPLAEAIGEEIGIGNAALDVWGVVKWPVLAAVITVMFAVLLFNGPNVEQESLRRLLPGSLLAMVLWLVASAGFATYVSHFGSYANTYGSIAGVIVFLIWLWISNLALLLGATYNVALAKA